MRKGDYAVVPTISISSRNVATRLLTSRNIEIKLGLNVFNGGTYNLIEFCKNKKLPYCVIHAPELFANEHLLDLCSFFLSLLMK